MKTLVFLAACVLAAACGGQTSSSVQSSEALSAPGVEVSPATAHDRSEALRDVPSANRVAAEAPNRPLHLIGAHSPGGVDLGLQSSPGPLIGFTSGLNIAGVGDGDYGFTPNAAPPDTNGAVGATQYVQWVNESFAVFNKTTGAIASGFPKTGNTVWSGFPGNCGVRNDGDPIVQYDKANARWILTQFSVPSGGPYEQCVAVSQTSDATGIYNRYSFSYGNTQFNDYPKLGVWPDAYYITFNIFNNASTFAGAKLCAYDKAAMLAGAPATQQCFQLSTSYGGVLPPDVDGATAPPAGAPAPFLNFGSNSLNLWRFHVDFANSANTTLSTPVNIPVNAFTEACGGGSCIPQPGTNNKLDSLADRLMYRLAYRNFTAAGHESLVVNHSIKASGSKRSEVDGVRWYELRSVTSGTPTVYQQGTYAPADGTSRWMGSIAMDKVGNIAVGYSASSGSLFPSIRFTARAAADPLGTLGTETNLLTGGGSQTGTLHRWGDYSALTVDPVDDCTFWYTNEYEKVSGSFNWSTRIASFKLAGCQ